MNEQLNEAFLASAPSLVNQWRNEASKFAAQYDRRFNLLMLNKDRYDSPWCNAWRALGALAETAASDLILQIIRESLLNDIPDADAFVGRLRTELPFEYKIGDYLLNTCSKTLFQAIAKWFAEKFRERLVPHLVEDQERRAIQSLHWMLCEPEASAFSWRLSIAAARTWSPSQYLQFAKELGDSKIGGIMKCLRLVYDLDLRQAKKIMDGPVPHAIGKED